jgi:hypothetical protein
MGLAPGLGARHVDQWALEALDDAMVDGGAPRQCGKDLLIAVEVAASVGVVRGDRGKS